VKPLELAIPCDERGCPDLQQLVRLRGGYPGITLEDWREFDRLKALWHARRREFASARQWAAGPSGPLAVCVRCGQEARFGYRNPATNMLSWFCAEHRLAQSWADARR
jgi:hypothetical protein